ncbi:SAP domain-containing protein [Micromonospora chersina]|uniref:SAP domain-containing protein n=1 Tax=Micromonospora chersina TaxID=47854 RepID=UPI00371CBDEA
MGMYDNLTADQLREQAEKRDLPKSGTKPELIARLEAADRDQATAPAEEPTQEAKANPLLADDGTVSVDDALAFTDQVRALAEEISDRLTAEVVEPLTGFETNVSAEGRSEVLTAASRRVRGHVDDLMRDLRALSASAGLMGQDVLR